ncbi:hypothetical protein [Oryzobacter terrae]|uniref:hypothetical protein n=1 Tax=Oryzobacter terrae TaxID=1620385 RepID=UPI003670F8C7
MRVLTESEVRVGARVLYGGEASERDVSAAAAEHGHILISGHPGVIAHIHGPGNCHVVVEFIGLEAEGISVGVGWDPIADGTYPQLFVPENAEWERALTAGWWAAQ